MSRCFPYPPPGYVRTPVAAAEADATTKLQKEMEKAEKKKEKRSDKKAKHGEVSKHSKRTHKKRKHEDISEAGQESQKGSKEPVEQLEKSGLSEEHGAPCFNQMVHGSPESSQDSSKRRKVVLPSPSQAKNGNILRIKIRRDQDSSSILEKSKIEQQPDQQMGSGSSLISKQDSIQLHTNKLMGSKSASTHQQSIKSDSQALLKKGTKHTAKVMQMADLLNTRNVTQQKDAPSSLKPSNARLGCPPVEMMASVGPSPTKLMGRVDPLPAKATQRVSPPVKVLQRVEPPAKALEVSQKETKLEVVPIHQNPKVPMGTNVMKQQQQQANASQPREEPCFSGRDMEAASVPMGKQSKSERKKSRKAEKKERKFKDLFVTWDPPSFEMEEMDLGDEDWLLGSKCKPDAGISNCREVAGPVPSHSVEQCSLQPRAIHLPDLHVYQLPYVVPF
ncbi:hypothetical protein GUJ93_ZPchr0006g45058 [Zizania palustris]|uniref:Uncharacterized protein n=1 Tax=Zizania palustris TaxID=103762 RepID=A0A8J5VNX2_ZIZPA|nr:hypothetical protein GUJ93_ZPchr0006g45058 [Zizania palustris]